MNPKFRQNLTRRARRIGEVGTVEFSIETSPADVTRVFSEFVDLEASGWKAGIGLINLGGHGGRFHHGSKFDKPRFFCIETRFKPI